MKPKNTNTNVQYLAYLGALVGLLLLLKLTPLGMIPIGPLEITTLNLPVIIAAIVLGPSAGAILGAGFGLLSFWDCFGNSVLGVALLSMNPFFTFLVCVPTRILTGYFCGKIFETLNHRAKGKNLMPFMAGSLSGSLLNTVLFVTMLLVLFGSSAPIMAWRGEAGLIGFIALIVGVNGVAEAVACIFIGTAVGFPLYRQVHRK